MSVRIMKHAPSNRDFGSKILNMVILVTRTSPPIPLSGTKVRRRVWCGVATSRRIVRIVSANAGCREIDDPRVRLGPYHWSWPNESSCISRKQDNFSHAAWGKIRYPRRVGIPCELKRHSTVRQFADESCLLEVDRMGWGCRRTLTGGITLRDEPGRGWVLGWALK
jgi:hypothetical protein